MTPQLEMVPAPGYSPMVGALVAMLEYTRATTLNGVASLGIAELDHQHDERANPIGAMLAHVAAIEWVHAVQTLGPPATAEVWAEWGPLIQLGPAAWAAARGHTLEAHVERLRAVRERTLEALRAVDDDWLTRAAPLPWLPKPATNMWAWYHVMEDELNHRGQIRWLRGRLPGAHDHQSSRTTE
jgi:uncharacterized damage-inducible protein DinB